MITAVVYLQKIKWRNKILPFTGVTVNLKGVRVMKFSKKISTILLVVILTGIFGVIPAYAKDMTIIDIPMTNPAYDIVKWVINEGYMSLTLGKFLPAKYVKRSEFASVVTKMSGSSTKLQNPKTPTFQDVTAKNQFYKQIESAKTYMTSFKSQTAKLFKPNSNLTREDAMFSIVKVLGYDSDEAVGSNDNTDLSLDNIIEDADIVSPSLVKFVSIGISYELMDLRIDGDKYYFDSKKSITRIDLAKLIYNAFQKKNYTVEETDIDEENSNTQDNSSASSQNNQPSAENPDSSTSSTTSTTQKYDISMYYSFLRGTVEKLAEPIQYINANNDGVIVTKLEPLGKLKNGQETEMIIEVEYSLTSQDKGILAVCFNNGDGRWATCENALENSIWEVSKGTGKYRFTIPVYVKDWGNGIPFRMLMKLRKTDSATICNTQWRNLSLD